MKKSLLILTLIGCLCKSLLVGMEEEKTNKKTTTKSKKNKSCKKGKKEAPSQQHQILIYCLRGESHHWELSDEGLTNPDPGE